MHLLGRVNSVSVRGYGCILWLYMHLVNFVSVPGLWWHIMIMHLADYGGTFLAVLIMFQCRGYGGIL